LNLKKQELSLMIKIENLIGQREKTLNDEERELLFQYMNLIENLITRRDKQNSKTWETIKDKRKTDKNYAR
jgi:hypothetical protein